jgi:hypothetical protein
VPKLVGNHVHIVERLTIGLLLETEGILMHRLRLLHHLIMVVVSELAAGQPTLIIFLILVERSRKKILGGILQLRWVHRIHRGLLQLLFHLLKLLDVRALGWIVVHLEPVIIFEALHH